MYELIHTSVENGLLPLTHGFATVAMTRHLPEALRNQVEMFCGYQHLSSANDASYYEKNPVNWFHVVLDKGAHLVGRVAPCKFDYTGRTNRLAKVRIFSAAEMPRCGAADLFTTDGEWFTQDWDGIVQYLEAHETQSAWTKYFGEEGDGLAQRLAWQIENTLATGRSIFFRTSTEWDVKGTKLLSLFAEIIRLMPEDKRACVTFSTYPSSLPTSTPCILRGSFTAQDDRLFEIAKDSNVWIDCPAGKVVHADLLPTEPPQKKVKTSEEPETPEEDNTEESISAAAQQAEVASLKHANASLKAELQAMRQVLNQEMAQTKTSSASHLFLDPKRVMAEKAKAEKNYRELEAAQEQLENQLARVTKRCWFFMLLTLALIALVAWYFIAERPQQKVEKPVTPATTMEKSAPIKFESKPAESETESAKPIVKPAEKAPRENDRDKFRKELAETTRSFQDADKNKDIFIRPSSSTQQHAQPQPPPPKQDSEKTITIIVPSSATAQSAKEESAPQSTPPAASAPNDNNRDTANTPEQAEKERMKEADNTGLPFQADEEALPF